MAIAGILIISEQEHRPRLQEALAKRADITAIEAIPEQGNFCGLCLVLERPVGELHLALEELSKMDGVLNLSLASINYEDDLEADRLKDFDYTPFGALSSKSLAGLGNQGPEPGQTKEGS